MPAESASDVAGRCSAAQSCEHIAPGDVQHSEVSVMIALGGWKDHNF